MNIQEILKGLGTAATNPLAFVAYLVAVISWLILRWRVDRNKNLLDRLQSIPQSQRASLLRAEMGVEEISDGMTAEQRLRSRIHTYYFLAFVVLCGVIVVLFAIAKFSAGQHAGVKDGVQKVFVTNKGPDDDDRALMQKLVQIDLGTSEDFVRSKLGEPNRSGIEYHHTCWSYVLPWAHAKFVFGSNRRLRLLYVVDTDPRYHYPLMGRWGSDEKAGELGNFSFNSLRDDTIKSSTGYSEPRNPPFETVPDVPLFNIDAHDATEMYAEKYQGMEKSDDRDLYVIWTDEGYDPEHDQDPTPNDIVYDLFSHPETASYLAHLPKSALVEMNKALDKIHPNAFAYISRPPYDTLSRAARGVVADSILSGTECDID